MATLDLLACVREMELERGLSHETVKGYAGAARNFGRHLGRVATTADLQTELVNAWLAGLAARLAPATILARKRGMTAVWNWAADRGLVEPYHPRRLRRVSCPRTSPTAWSYSDVLRLLDACQRLPGKLRCGIPANLLLRATLLLAWDSGLRLGDLIRLRRRDLGSDGIVRVIQHKTGYPHAFRLHRTTIAAVDTAAD